MKQITTVGLDLAKSVFQVHCADGDGRPVVRKKLRRSHVAGFFAGLSSCLVEIPVPVYMIPNSVRHEKVFKGVCKLSFGIKGKQLLVEQ